MKDDRVQDLFSEEDVWEFALSKGPMLYSKALGRLGIPQLAQDVVSYCWEELHKSILRGYVFKYTSSVAYLLFKKFYRSAIADIYDAEPHLAGDFDDYSDDEEPEHPKGIINLTPGTVVDFQSAEEHALATLDLEEFIEFMQNNLSPTQLECMKLFLFECMSTEDIGKALGKKTSTVNQHLMRAKRKIRNRFPDYMPDSFRKGTPHFKYQRSRKNDKEEV